MQLLLEEICQHLRNWFCNFQRGDVKHGSFIIQDGAITGAGQTPTPTIEDGSYYRIIGSLKNDGVFLAGTDTPKDETFTGQIWLMHPTAAFLACVKDISDWNAKNGAIDSPNMSPYTSESFGGYSYSKGGGGSQGGTATTWQGQFASRLNAWRKI